MKTDVPTEDEEQIVVVHYLEMKGYPFSHIPNSTFTKSWKVKMRNKMLGVRPGLPDLFCIIKNKPVWIEMKRKKGGVLSKYQEQWVEDLSKAGMRVWVCRGADEAIEQIKKLEEIENGRH